MAGNRKPVIVAELGRPETASETAARKANDSRMYRQRKTVNNLVFSLLVCLGAVLIIVLMVPRGTGDVETRTVDVTALAAESSSATGFDLVVPQVPTQWKPRQAELRTDGNVTYWYIGYTTVNGNQEAYAAVVQALDTNGAPVDEAWISKHLEQRSATGVEQHGGAQWIAYDHSTKSPDGSNVLFALEQQVEGATLLVYGTDSPDVIRDLAAATQASFDRISR